MREKILLEKFKKQNISNVSMAKYILWYCTGYLFLNSFLPGSSFKKLILRFFGAKIGSNVIIKPFVKIKFPWKLEIGNDSWIGEGVWIDNIDDVKIGHDTYISQGVYLCSGNHNFKLQTFDLKMEKIIIENHCWIVAKAIIRPGTIIEDQTFIKLGNIL